MKPNALSIAVARSGQITVALLHINPKAYPDDSYILGVSLEIRTWPDLIDAMITHPISVDYWFVQAEQNIDFTATLKPRTDRRQMN